MGLPDINFEKIRPHDGSRHTGFEKMCCQLASREPLSEGDKFVSKGRGGDAGVECFIQRADRTEVGWQAKYLFEWNSSLENQLTKSINTALKKHPKLVEYIVCLPFDLPDARTEKKKTARQKWDCWCAKCKKSAKKQVKITLWGETELSTRLTKDDPTNSGCLLYWFDQELASKRWFMEQFQKTKVSLGNRYTPETNVELSIRQDFLAFARNSLLQKQIDEWHSRVLKKGRTVVDDIRKIAADAVETHSNDLNEAIHGLASLLDGDPIECHQLYPLDKWNSAVSDCLKLTGESLRWVFGIAASGKSGNAATESERWAQRSLYELTNVLNEIEGALTSDHWRLVNVKTVLLQGPAGIGKSHLLADIVEHQIQHGNPALLFLGNMFVDGEPWRQILNQLDRPPTEQIKHFLGSLDAAAQVADARAIVCIDALNERYGIDVWRPRLAAFLNTMEMFPRISIILSCRTTYVPHLIPDELSANQLYRLDHTGFAADGGEAARIYLEKRGIALPGVPNIIPEFENPLFLKTCCDSLEKEGKTELPKGLRGVTSIFKFYTEAVTRQMNQRMKLDKHQEIVQKAIHGFSKLLVDENTGFADKHKVVNLFESILNSGGSLEKSLLTQLESEGLLTVEMLSQNDGPSIELVRFTFERMSDHVIAKRLLDDHLDESDVTSSFHDDQPLQTHVFGPNNFARAGIIEAIAIQLPERTKIEILDVGNQRSSVVDRAFQESLLWREQSHFSNRTFELAQDLLDPFDFNDLLVSISTEPTNEFNACFVHNYLLKMTMPGRDALWSVSLADRGFDGNIKTLISWALKNGQNQMDEERAGLAATMLTWFLSASHREIRDKATKALASILCRRLPLAVRLLVDFAEVDDLYIRERLLAACYGAALQGCEESGLSELAQSVFDTVFADGRPPANTLLRDHAQGIVEFAAWREALHISIDLSLSRPPYHSPWPIEAVPDALIESYEEDNGQGVFHDKIVSSTVYDGDFARYVVDHKLNKWSSALLGTSPLPTSREVYETWKQEFSSSASAEQQQALDFYIAAAEEVNDAWGYQQPMTITEPLDNAESALQYVMAAEEWETFRVQAKDFIRHQMFSGRQDQVDRFNVKWGRRWICKRAHELGWTPERFGTFDNQRGYNRTNHRVERIGKKYQWLALQELLARMSDNLAFLGNPWVEDTKNPPINYRGTRQIDTRDIDPSLLTTKTHYDEWQEWDGTWWVPFSPNLRSVGPHQRIAWLESDDDIINDTTLIDLHNPNTGQRWLALSGFSHWSGPSKANEGQERQRNTWFRLNCIVVRLENLNQCVKNLQKRILTDPNSFPDPELSGYFYLGEYPWHTDVREFTERNLDISSRTCRLPIRATVVSYHCGDSGYDYSIDRTIRIEVPALWLAKKMELRLSRGQSPIYVDPDGRELFYDPSVIEAGPAAALVERDAFLEMLARNDFSAIWVIAGEKHVFGSGPGQDYGGGLQHTAVYHFGDNIVKKSPLCKKMINPTEIQRAYFFGKSESEF